MNFGIIPTWAYWVTIAALAGAVGVQQVRVAKVHTELSNEQAARSAETSARSLAALADAKKVKDLTAAHAVAIQENDNAWREKLQAQTVARAADRVLIGRLRDNLATFTSGDRREGESDAVALARTSDRLQLVGGLVRESNDLLAEARGIVQQRDTEVKGLLAIITADRKACGAE